MDLASLRATLDSEAGRSLKEYLTLQLETLKSIDNLEDTTVIEVRSQRKAYKKLKEILEGIVTLTEEVKTKDPRDSYDI